MSIVSYSQDASRNPHTITRWILQEQKKFPKAKGDLTIVLNSVTLACKIISAAAKGAGIFQRYGMGRLKEEAITALPNYDQLNTSLIDNDDEEKKQASLKEGIFAFAYDSVIGSVSWCGKIPMMLSTNDSSTIINIAECEQGKYILVFDPIDGKQNIKVNASVGTIFGVYKVKDASKPAKSDCLQSGSELVCAGYALYGDATVMMLSFGDIVNGFTLDPTIGEFVLTHKNVRIPEAGTWYSTNEGYAEEWNDAVKEYVGKCKKPKTGQRKKSRYIGCMVADIHSTLLRGGVYMYPETNKFPGGKLNLQCECNPLAFIVTAAGGRASNGRDLIMDIKPTSTDQRTPIFIGSQQDVMEIEKLYATLVDKK
eukprot:107611_1